jgi:hypothetical protein
MALETYKKNNDLFANDSSHTKVMYMLLKRTINGRQYKI